MRAQFRGLAAIALLAAVQGSAAAGLPAYYPAEFPTAGRVDAIAYTERQVVINDVLFKLAPDVVVRTPSAASDSLYGVRTGQHVGFRYERTERGRVVHEIWVLPGAPRHGK
jgi:hypothetical protein